MSKDVIQAQYENLTALAAGFDHWAGTTAELETRLRQATQELQQGWQGQAATAFNAEMANSVFPALRRLSAALGAGKQALQRAAGILRAAEEAAAQPFRGHGPAAAPPAAAAAAAGMARSGAEPGRAPAQAGHGTEGSAAPAVKMAGNRADLDPEFAAKLDRVAARMKALGYDAKIASGHRTLAQQVQLYTAGRTFEQFKTGLLEEVRQHRIGGQEAQKWIDYYDPAKGNHAMTRGPASPVTWTVASEHLVGRGADIVDPVRGWNVTPAYWDALHQAAKAEGLEVPLPVKDKAHVQLRPTRR